MPTVEKRTGSGGVTSRATVRVLHRTHTKTFKRLTDAKRWAQSTEAAIREARHFPKAEAQKHTVRDMIDRYRTEVLPKKGPSMVRNQTITTTIVELDAAFGMHTEVREVFEYRRKGGEVAVLPRLEHYTGGTGQPESTRGGDPFGYRDPPIQLLEQIQQPQAVTLEER